MTNKTSLFSVMQFNKDETSHSTTSRFKQAFFPPKRLSQLTFEVLNEFKKRNILLFYYTKAVSLSENRQDTFLAL